MTTIKLKNGSGAPTAGDLAQGEPALDLTNKRLYTEDSGGTVIEVGTNPGTDVTFADNRKAIFGAGSDLQIYHDGSNSYVQDAGDGALILNTTNGGGVYVYSAGETMATFNSNGAVNLYHDNASKLATTSTGIDVTGTVTADGLTSDGNVSVVGAGNTRTIGFDFYGSSKYNFHVDGATDADKMFVRRGTTNVANFASNGDISFYDSSGTSQSLYWDASVESLGIGTTSFASALSVATNGGSWTTSASDGVGINYNSGNANISTYLDNSTLKIGAGVTQKNGITIYGQTGGNRVTFDVAGSERMRIDSSGNVGIGTDSPSAKLDLGSSTGQKLLMYANNNIKYGMSIETSEYRMFAEDQADLTFGHMARSDGSTYSEAMRIDSNGNVGIGTDSPSAISSNATTLRIKSLVNTKGGAVILESADESLRSYFYPTSTGTQLGTLTNHDLLFMTNTTERMRIDSSGNVGIGMSPSGALSVRPSGTGSEDSHIGFGANLDAYITTGSDGIVVFREGNGSGGNTERMRIDSSGNLLVGTTSARNSREVSIDGAINAGTASSVNGGVTLESYYSSGSLNSWGSVASSGGAAMCYGVHPKTGSQTTFTSSTGIALNRGAFVIDDNIKWYTGSNQTVAVGSDVTMTEKMRLDVNGNLLVGTTEIDAGIGDTTGTDKQMSYRPSQGYRQKNGTNFFNTIASGDFYRFRYQGGQVGSINIGSTTTAYNTSSDQRLKENIVDAPSASDDIDAIQVRSFDWKADGSHQKYGMVAQELQTVAPEAVSEGATEDDMMGVDYSKLVPMMLKEIQSLRARVAQLEGAN
jgi:hypothetical protein